MKRQRQKRISLNLKILLKEMLVKSPDNLCNLLMKIHLNPGEKPCCDAKALSASMILVRNYFNLDIVLKLVKQIIWQRLYSFMYYLNTGKSSLEALILASTNPQYDKRLFIELHASTVHENCKLRTSREHVVYINSSECQNKNKKTIYLHNMFSWCSELVVFMYWTGNSMNNLLSYCGLVDARISGSEKDLPVCWFLCLVHVVVKIWYQFW